MAKTKPTAQSVNDFINTVRNPTQKAEAKHLLKLFKEVSGEKAVMWGPGIIGFGSYHYVYASGREGDWPIVGYSPRKQNLSIYIMSGFSGSEKLMEKLGKHKTGKSCLYIKRLADVDEEVLRKLIDKSVGYIRSKYETSK